MKKSNTINMSGNPEGNKLPEVISRLAVAVTLVLVCLPSIPVSTSASSSAAKSWSSRVVTTKLGLARGFVFVPKGYEGVEVFLGLPYASPPVGSLRLMPPVSVSPWSGTKMSDQPSQVCPQVFPFPLHAKSVPRTTATNNGESGSGGSSGFDENRGSGGLNDTEILKTMPRGKLVQLNRLAPFLMNQSEDCLYLNIYVPLSVAEGKTDALLPILVFIHGDDNSYGAGYAYDPSMLASQGNLIVITFNFRLGILGFLNANSDGYFKSPANFALLDQIAALHWVQENIGAFGGDRGNVTLMGHGKGAMFVNFLMISNALPSSEPLFHRVILMSGSALSPFTVGLSYGKDLAKKFAGRFKCPIEPPSNMLQCLRQLPLQYFLDSDLWKYFGPSDDGVVIESGIRENVLRDRISRFPMIFGVTKAEFLPTLSEHDAVYGLETEKRREVLKLFIDGFYSSTYRSEILAAAIHEYTDWERPVQHPISVRDETLDALTDAQIVAPMVKVGELHSQANSRTYFYVFEYQSKISDYVQRLGCVPGEDLMYVFGVPLYLSSANAEYQAELSEWDEPGGTSVGGSGTGGSGNSNSIGGGAISALDLDDGVGLRLGVFSGNFTRNEVQLSHTLVHHWANFIKTGNPNVEGAQSALHPEGSYPGGFSVSGGENRFPLQDKSSSSSLSFKPKFIEWPPYDPLFKKYLSIEAKPRIRSHYRAHKLSFWLHLVPELMRNGYGNGGGGGISPTFHSPDGHGYPNIINSSNSTLPHPPSIQLVGPPYWEQHPFYFSGNYSSYPGGDISGPLGSRPNHRFHNEHGGDGFQIYSTALSVTIAVGSSLLILNILAFAAFYYFRDKRRTARHSSSRSGLGFHHHHAPGPISATGGSETDPSTFSPMDLQLHGISAADNQRQLSYSSAETMGLPSAHNTPSRLKENGHVLNLLPHNQHQISRSPQIPPMTNICGDLPISSLQQLLDSGRSSQQYQPQQHQQYQRQHSTPNCPNPNSNLTYGSNGANGGVGGHQSSTLPSNKRQQQRASLQNFELSMPDAILAAAMMLNYRQNNSSQVPGGSDFFFGTGHKSSSVGKRPGLNMKEQLLLSAASSNAPGASSLSSGASTASSGFTNLDITGNGAGVVLGNLPGRSPGYTTPGFGSSGGDGANCANPNVCDVRQFDFDNGSKTVPRPPKRHTPTVKFSPDTFISLDGSICSASGSGSNANVSASAGTTLVSSTSIPIVTANLTPVLAIGGPNPANLQAQTPQLKSSLKKHSNYTNPGTSDELNV